ncbi:hypothetical protein C7A10_08700 [Pseudomonas fluorescens]|uniref:Uncharacterized protein n=1 Tax=Pseudomonas fluorescens TaxID=294 RepID=A0A2T0IFC5_PSEFL|nr:hypothetical protein C7A10_08700 [Pseudomonas fluorescens]
MFWLTVRHRGQAPSHILISRDFKKMVGLRFHRVEPPLIVLAPTSRLAGGVSPTRTGTPACEENHHAPTPAHPGLAQRRCQRLARCASRYPCPS